MKKILLLLAAFTVFSAAAITFPTETFRYEIRYHLGFINKTAGYGEISVACSDDVLEGTLHGASIDWGGRVYSVNDTLVARMAPAVDAACSRETVEKCSGWYFKPLASELSNGTYNRALPQNHKTISGGGTLDASPSTMEAVDITANMLSMFYYFKQIPFERMSPGQTFHIDIAEPGYAGEYVDIQFEGPSVYSWRGESVPTYKILFEYSYRGQSSNYPVTSQVSRDGRRPLLFEASLPIGKMQMIQTRLFHLNRNK